MNDRDFSFSKLESSIVGAGVIPISIVNNNVKFLLGKERYINHWRGSLKWSGFEGGKKFNEKIKDTACREFMEESLAVISLSKDHNGVKYSDLIRDIIKNENYFARIILCINHNNGEQPAEKRYHMTYVVEVPYEFECVEKFNQTRKKLIDFHFRLTQFKKITETLVNEYPFIMKDSIVQNKKVKAITSVSMYDNELLVQYIDEDSNKRLRESCLDMDAAKTYMKWFCARNLLHKEVQTFSYLEKAVEVEYDCV